MPANGENPAGFVVLVPARLASTRLPDKPLADIGGVPMIVRVAQRAASSGAARVVVATDSERIARAVRDHGFQALITGDHHPSGTDRLAEASATLALDSGVTVVNVQGDEPLIPPSLIDRVATRLAEDPECPMATAAHPINSIDDFLSPHVVKVTVDASRRAMAFSRAPIPWPRDAFAGLPQQRPNALPAGLPVLRHIGIYAYRAGFLAQYPRLAPSPYERFESLEQLRVLWHGHRIAVAVCEEAPPAGVDTPEDLARVRALVARQQSSRRLGPDATRDTTRDTTRDATHDGTN